MATPHPEEESFADGAAGTNVYEAPKPLKKQFEAWHRPRKQFVRDKQWREQIERLLSDIGEQNYLLRYLGLPGTDLLDLRHFHAAVCQPKSHRLKFLGFNRAADPRSDAQGEMDISLDEVRKLEFVDPLSDIVPDDFRRIAADGSIAWQRTREFGPCDVINIDLCDGFTVDPPGAMEDTLYNAMNRVVTMQVGNTRPWLLFLTTRVGPQHIHGDALSRLTAKFSQNLNGCPAFLAASRDHFSIEDDAAINAACQSQKGMLDVCVTAVCKWFLGLVVGASPAWSVELKSAVGYQVDGHLDAEDLISLALRFTPSGQSLPDPMGLAAQPGNAPDECALAAAMAARVARRKNADTILAEDAALAAEMESASCTLLEQSRYDGQEYRIWLAGLSSA